MFCWSTLKIIGDFLQACGFNCSYWSWCVCECVCVCTYVCLQADCKGWCPSEWQVDDEWAMSGRCVVVHLSAHIRTCCPSARMLCTSEPSLPPIPPLSFLDCTRHTTKGCPDGFILLFSSQPFFSRTVLYWLLLTTNVIWRTLFTVYRVHKLLNHNHVRKTIHGWCSVFCKSSGTHQAHALYKLLYLSFVSWPVSILLCTKSLSKFCVHFNFLTKLKAVTEFTNVFVCNLL